MTAGGSPHGSSSTTSILQSQKHRIALACLLDVALNAAKTDKVACFEWATDGDAFACLGARAQRAFYEAILAALALAGDHPSSLLLLAVTAALIGIGDLIFHAPLYALTAHRRDCECVARSTWGWCIDKACTSDTAVLIGRVSVVLQSTATGFFFLRESILAWRRFKLRYDEKKMERQADLNSRYLAAAMKGPRK